LTLKHTHTHTHTHNGTKEALLREKAADLALRRNCVAESLSVALLTTMAEQTDLTLGQTVYIYSCSNMEEEEE